MKADFTFMKREDESSEKVTLERIEMEDTVHVPRVGDRIHFGGRDYDVFEVTWDFEKGVVFIAASF